MKSKETPLVKACLAHLHIRGIVAWRNNTGAVKTGDRFIRYGAVGSPDIIGLLPNGRFLGVECKVGKRKQTPDQVAFGEAITNSGGVYIVARTVDDVADMLDANTN